MRIKRKSEKERARELTNETIKRLFWHIKWLNLWHMGQMQAEFFFCIHFPFCFSPIFELYKFILLLLQPSANISISIRIFPLFWFYIVVSCLLHLFSAVAAAAAAFTDDMLMFAILIQTPPNAVNNWNLCHRYTVKCTILV